MKIAIILIGVIVAWAIAFGLTEVFKIKQRWVACVLMFGAVITVAVMAGVIAATAIEPGDFEESTHRTAITYVPGVSWKQQKQITLNVFLIAILPALIGAWMATTGNRNAVERGEAKSSEAHEAS